MPGKRIKDLTALSGAGSANDDDVVIFDTTADITKRISRSQLAEGMQSDVQVLTNKTLALGSNTVTGTTVQFNTALTDGDFATLAGSGVLTNKTIDSATNTLTVNYKEAQVETSNGSRTHLFTTVAALLADTGTYTTYTAGQIVEAGGFRYTVAATGATDHHVITAGSVKLYVLAGERGYNVKAFGAVGNGIAVDTTAVQTAINTIKSTTGGAVYFPTGTYLCAVVVDGNQRVDLCGDGHSSVITSATVNEFSVKYESNFRPCQVRNIRFENTGSKVSHGLYVNTGANFGIHSCVFRNCGMGLVFNGTIDTDLVDAYFYENYIALYYTCRTTAGSPTVTQINGQSYTFSSAFFPQQPGESDIFGVFINNNNIGVIVDQPDNPYAYNSNLKFWGGLVQASIVGIIGDLGNQGPPTNINGTWFENLDSGTVAFNGTTYSAPNDIYITSGRISVNDTAMQAVTLKNTSTMKASNTSMYATGVITKDAGASFIGDRCEPNDAATQGAKNYIRAPGVQASTATSVTRTTNPSGFSYRYSTKTRTSRKLVNADTVSFFGAGSSTNVVDGVLDVKECKEVTLLSASEGPIIFNNPAGTIASKWYVGLIGIRLISGNPSIRVFNAGAGASFGFTTFDATADWRTYCFIRQAAITSTAGSLNVIGATTPTTVIRISGEYVVEFDTAEEVAEFLDANTFPLI